MLPSVGHSGEDEGRTLFGFFICGLGGKVEIKKGEKSYVNKIGLGGSEAMDGKAGCQGFRMVCRTFFQEVLQ